jgi:hypothetical protein
MTSDTSNIQRATEWRNHNLTYLRGVDRHRLRGTLDLYVRELVRRLPAIPGTQRAAEHLTLTAVTLMLLVLTSRDGVLVAGIPYIAEQAGTSERTVSRASKWLRNVCRAMNRPKRGRKGEGVNHYTLPLSIVTEIANRVRAAGQDASRKGKRMRDKSSQSATSADVAPPSPPSGGFVGRMAQALALRRALGQVGDECEHGAPPGKCALCRSRSLASGL